MLPLPLAVQVPPPAPTQVQVQVSDAGKVSATVEPGALLGPTFAAGVLEDGGGPAGPGGQARPKPPDPRPQQFEYEREDGHRSSNQRQ